MRPKELINNVMRMYNMLQNSRTSTARYNLQHNIWYGMVWYGTAWYGMEGDGMVPPSFKALRHS